MKMSLDHLPESKQRNVARIVETIHEEFEDALKEAKSENKRRGRILKIILLALTLAALGLMNPIR